MARKIRRKSNSGIYHIMMRGVNKQTIFEEDEDRYRFLETLKRYKRQSKFQLYSYCLMNNHIHLLMKEDSESISDSMKRISSSYVYWYNFKYDRCGPLFQDRFRSECVDSQSYFLKVLRYIHQNPLKAGLAKSVEDSKWTSIREYKLRYPFVDVDVALNLFSEDRAMALKYFLEYINEINEDECLEDIQRVRMNDDEVRAVFREKGISNISTLQRMDKVERDRLLFIIKSLEGVSLRQISRITGIPKSIIHRVHPPLE
ncbi:transposase [Cytobacillus spongiae]|uniref:transposase n=1 Tax=Cytobacillus spongiae TaxID=2901381 RepID=UPI001F3B0923|nr:transposase [Cytobacillus spongiae]UII55650.1 transposase [Cytobacillus spongiae]